ncbi:phosphotransferase [Candidatus Woesearchaeota archaeon]|nr:phosphotransferase [Candidatus Woesearchaeota archaeon]
MKELLLKFGVDFSHVLDVKFYGSPERTSSRVCVVDTNGVKYVLESFKDFSRKSSILKFLRSVDLPVLEYVGDIVYYNGLYYKLSKYVASSPLDQSSYGLNFNMGKSVGEFLLHLWSLELSVSLDNVDYFAEVSKLVFKFPQLEKYYSVSLPVVKSIDSFSFAHGDLHPMNILWSNDSVLKVIDWEFFGVRYSGYDLANLIGCVGIENPSWLTADFVRGLLSTVRQIVLPELVLFSRFAWMIEWVNKKDVSMISLELDYMEYLFCNLEELRSTWASFSDTVD